MECQYKDVIQDLANSVQELKKIINELKSDKTDSNNGSVLPSCSDCESDGICKSVNTIEYPCEGFKLCEAGLSFSQKQKLHSLETEWRFRMIKKRKDTEPQFNINFLTFFNSILDLYYKENEIVSNKKNADWHSISSKEIETWAVFLCIANSGIRGRDSVKDSYIRNYFVKIVRNIIVSYEMHIVYFKQEEISDYLTMLTKTYEKISKIVYGEE